MPTEHELRPLLADLRAGRDAMTALLRELASVESPSREPASQEAMFAILARELAGCGFRSRRIEGRRTGGQLLAVPEDRKRGRPFQLLLGHTDTVWPPGTLDRMPVDARDGVMRGPGVFDMKGGLVQAVFALKALRDHGFRPDVTPVLFLTSDEEIGSPESRRHVVRLARRAERAYVLEPALGPAGALKTARKGTGSFVVHVTGRGAHVGLDPEQGASAIQELASVVQRLHALSELDRGVTVNVGEVEGGIRPNVVAPRARATVDVRVPTPEDGRQLESTIRELEASTPGTRLEVEGGMDRPPMERTPRNRRLWEAAREAARRLDLEVEEGTAGGASDGNFTSVHTATLDGLGAVGGGAHAETEHVELERMPERAALLAALLLEPAADESASGGEPPAGGRPPGTGEAS